MKNENFETWFCSFFQTTSKVQWFSKFWSLHRKNHIKIYQMITSFYLFFILKLIKNRFFLGKKLEIQLIAFMLMLNCSSGRIFNPMLYTGVTIYLLHNLVHFYTWLHLVKFEANKKQFFSSEKMRNLDNCIYPIRYTGVTLYLLHNLVTRYVIAIIYTRGH